MIRLRTLGAPDLRAPGGRELRGVLAQPKRTALLAYLALRQPVGFQRRDTLLGLFWPDADARHARNALRQALHFLRDALGDGVLVSRGGEELGLAPERVWCDAVAFERKLDAGELVTALELYGDDLLPGFFLNDAPTFERWLEDERQRLRERAATAAWAVAERAAAGGDAGGALHWARWACTRAPDDERAVRRRLGLLVRAGDRAGALHAYEQFAARLKQDYGADPDPETRACVRALEPVPYPAPAPAPAFPAPPPPPAPVLLPSPSAAHAAPSRRRVAPVLLPVVALALGLGVLVRLGPNGHAAAPAAANAVAVLPFPVHGHAGLAYLRDGMVDLMSTQLDGAGGLRSVDPRAVLAVVGHDDSAGALDPARAAGIAERLGAGVYVVGDVVAIAGRLQVTATVYERGATAAGWELRTRTSVEGDADHLFELVDQLAVQLLATRGEPRDTTLAHLAGLSTRSLPAFKAYLAGQQALRAGRYEEAVDLFQRAVALDSLFALAYYRLAVATDWIGNADAAAAAARAAFRHSDRLPPLVRGLLGGFTSYTAQRVGDAEITYRAIARTHPDNVEAAYMLGETLFHYNSARGRPFLESRAAFEQVLALVPGDAAALLHLARISAAEGRQGELDSLARRFLALHADADRTLEMRALRAFGAGDRVEQQRIRTALAGASDVLLDAVTRTVATYDQDLAGAEALAALYTTHTRFPSWPARGHELRAQLELARGRWRHAVAELDGFGPTEADWALETHALLATVPGTPASRAELGRLEHDLSRWVPQAPPLPPGTMSAEYAPLRAELRPLLLGLVRLRLDDTAAARRAADALARLPAPQPGVASGADLAHLVRAELLARQGAGQEALAEVERFPFDAATGSRFPQVSAHARFLRAELLRGLGRDAEALTWYGSFPDPYSLAYLAPAHLRQAEIAAQLGQRDAAISHYARVVSFWSDCEPESQVALEDARRALAAARGTE